MSSEKTRKDEGLNLSECCKQAYDCGKEAGRKEHLSANLGCGKCQRIDKRVRMATLHKNNIELIQQVAQLEKEKQQAYDQGWRHGEESGRKELIGERENNNKVLADALHKAQDKIAQLEAEISAKDNTITELTKPTVIRDLKAEIVGLKKNPAVLPANFENYQRMCKENTRLRDALEKIATGRLDKGDNSIDWLASKCVRELAKKALGDDVVLHTRHGYHESAEDCHKDGCHLYCKHKKEAKP